jgi:hypothetical protein
MAAKHAITSRMAASDSPVDRLDPFGVAALGMVSASPLDLR